MPLPVLVSPKPVPETTPDRVSCVPLTATVLAPPKVTVPAKLLVPVDVAKVPPLSATASVPTTTPRKSRVAPLSTVTPPALVPSAVSLVKASVPALTVVVPE